MDINVKLQLKELELSSLSETIKAINANASEEHLYRIYRFTMHSYKSISKMVLFVLNEEEQECKASFGTANTYTDIKLSDFFTDYHHDLTKDTNLLQVDLFCEFDAIVPIRHKNKLLAVVFLGKADKSIKPDLLNLSFFETLTNIIIVAIENKKFARKAQKQEELRKQLEIARQVQTLLFPKQLPYNEHIKIAASYKPHHSVGGDYYDYIQIDENRFLICIADVSGKGIPAAMVMSNFQAALRVLVKHGTPMKKIVQDLNALILENSGGSKFVTAFFAEYDSKNELLTYINAGHNPPFLYQTKNQTKYLVEGTVMLGAFPTLPFLASETINTGRFLLFCFTDGFIETSDDSGKEFGEDQLFQFIQQHIHDDQKNLHEQLIEELRTFKGSRAYVDDITLLSCRVGQF